MKKLDSIDIATSEFGRSKRTVSASQMQLGMLRSQVLSFSKGGVGNGSNNNFIAKAKSLPINRMILIMHHIQQVVRAADRKMSTSATYNELISNENVIRFDLSNIDSHISLLELTYSSEFWQAFRNEVVKVNCEALHYNCISGNLVVELYSLAQNRDKP